MSIVDTVLLRTPGPSTAVAVQGTPVGLTALRGGRLATAAAEGMVQVWDAARAPVPAAVPPPPPAAASAFDVGPNVEVLVSSPSQEDVAVGGRNHGLQVWDVETGATTFKARNVPHDFLDMAVPVWLTGAHVRWRLCASSLLLLLLWVEAHGARCHLAVCVGVCRRRPCVRRAATRDCDVHGAQTCAIVRHPCKAPTRAHRGHRGLPAEVHGTL